MKYQEHFNLIEKNRINCKHKLFNWIKSSQIRIFNNIMEYIFNWANLLKLKVKKKKKNLNYFFIKNRFINKLKALLIYKNYKNLTMFQLDQINDKSYVS